MIRPVLVLGIGLLLGACVAAEPARLRLQQFQALCTDLPPSTFGGGWVLMPPLSGDSPLTPEEVQKQFEAMNADAYRTKVEQQRAVCRAQRMRP
jgi:hypothetical protein